MLFIRPFVTLLGSQTTCSCFRKFCVNPTPTPGSEHFEAASGAASLGKAELLGLMYGLLCGCGLGTA